jgi:hypothetical protein
MSTHRRTNEHLSFMRARSAMHADASRAPALGVLLLVLGCSRESFPSGTLRDGGYSSPPALVFGDSKVPRRPGGAALLLLRATCRVITMPTHSGAA